MVAAMAVASFEAVPCFTALPAVKATFFASKREMEVGTLMAYCSLFFLWAALTEE